MTARRSQKQQGTSTVVGVGPPLDASVRRQRLNRPADPAFVETQAPNQGLLSESLVSKELRQHMALDGRNSIAALRMLSLLANI